MNEIDPRKAYEATAAIPSLGIEQGDSVIVEPGRWTVVRDMTLPAQLVLAPYVDAFRPLSDEYPPLRTVLGIRRPAPRRTKDPKLTVIRGGLA